jgi:hypothetical protein
MGVGLLGGGHDMTGISDDWIIHFITGLSITLKGNFIYAWYRQFRKLLKLSFKCVFTREYCNAVVTVFQAHNRLVADLDSMGFQVEETQSFANEVTSAMTKLKDKDVRIILGNFNESWARRVFCEAHRYRPMFTLR